MIEVEKPGDLRDHLGSPLGPSDWMVITQELIDGFAQISGDHNWIHVDRERAALELPDGKTIAHGWLTLSLITRLSTDFLKVRKRGKGINYGANRVRFIEPVQCGDSIRLRRSIKAVSPEGNFWKIVYDNSVEIKGKVRPAMVAETLSIIFEAGG